VTPDGWIVRFERQFTRPAETVWPHLTGEGTATEQSEPKVLECEQSGGKVRWELTEGIGHGARLVSHPNRPEQSRRGADNLARPPRQARGGRCEPM
jgi:hypothetical protein